MIEWLTGYVMGLIIGIAIGFAVGKKQKPWSELTYGIIVFLLQERQKERS